MARDKAREELESADQWRLDAYYHWKCANERLKQAEYAVQVAEGVHLRASGVDADAKDAVGQAYSELQKYMPKRKVEKEEGQDFPF
jgi:hypothetical protein